jgi:thioredoxin 1
MPLQGKKGEAMAEPIAVTDDSFTKDVKESDLPVVVDFWASWCGPCKMVDPIVKELAEELDGKVVFAKVNTDENLETPTSLGVQGIPTLIFFRDGQEVGRVVGFRPKAQLLKAIEADLLQTA